MSPTLQWKRARGAAIAMAAALLLALAPPASAQQTGTVQGSVVDAQSLRPLAGAQVTIPGTNLGGLTNAQGRFTVSAVPAGEVTVRVQSLGFTTGEQTVTVTAGGTASMEFQLRVSALALDEIVATGVGQATARRQLSTSVAVLGAEEIRQAPVQTVDQLLQGRVAGASVNAVSAQPGTASLMNFRGISSVFGAQTPVIYVDGVRVDNSQSTAAGTGGEQTSALAELLTADIERIEITKGGAASTLYGSDAATGVIQIFTRRGTPGAPRITARVEQGVDTPELRYMLDAGLIYPGQVENGNVPADFLAREYFRNGHNQSYSLSVSGGTGDVTYSMSGQLQQGDGIQPKNQSELFGLRGGMQAQLSDRFVANFSGGYTRTNFGRLFNGSAISDPLTAMEVGDALFFGQTDDLNVALDRFLMPDIDESVNRFQFSTGFTYQISDYLSSRASVGVDHRNNQQRIFQPVGFIPGNVEGSLNRRQREFTSVTMDAAATFSYPTDGDITSSFTVGAQGFRDNTSVVNGFGRGFALPGSKDFSEAADVTAFENNSQLFTGGVFFDEQIGLWGRLFVNLGMRIDAGTSFGDEVSFEAYPKAGVAYNISDELFFQDAMGNLVNQFRFRAAYGETGKFPPPFLRDRTFDATSFRGEAAPRFDNPGNPDLRPEVTETLEFGFDAGFLNDRIGVDFTYYDARTKDALFFVPEQPVTGQGTQIRNVGTIENSGIELEVNVQVLNRPNFAWSLGSTYQTVDNLVTDTGGSPPFFLAGPRAHQRIAEGHPVGAWFVDTPLDTTGDGLLDGTHQVYTGKGPTPTKSGSFSTRMTLYGNLYVSAMADWATGHEVFDFGSLWATFNGIARKELVDEDFEFPIRYTRDGERIGRYSQGAARSAFLEDGDWLKLREISVRYALPADLATRLGASQGTVYGSVRNAAIWSASQMVDGELAGVGVGGGLTLGGQTSVTLSPPRSFRFGVEFTF
ncbi:MAG: SusC/RagA family TonB-linked outer membrane protein [Gemmatimonadales bacterium]|nr:MAG: SusC/RagA family TonB-linked outer membrane protein [Gemmatimonadales bacterium]